MIEISVVTGTYNRLMYLQAMVNSVRENLDGRVPFEVVVVDGGSTDGTQGWCRQQQDVKLVEHGKLFGAVRAFNDGADQAVGRYVILANDDIVFNDRSILRAFAFMEDRTDVGVGCFYQDRGGREWHVEVMPSVIDGRQATSYYGQVCIVPRWLGDKVGWWGAITRTYGGDNELSANVLEAGYKIEPIKCACISDLVVEDELRQVNRGNPEVIARSGGQHPDTTAWYAKWTRPNGLVGPIVVKQPIEGESTLQPKRRVLYAPIYEPGNAIQRHTKVGLLRAMQEFGCVVYEYDYVARGLYDFPGVADDFQPHVFLLQVQDAKTFDTPMVKWLKNNYPRSKFVSWNGDYHLNQLLEPKYMQLMRLFDLATFVSADIAQKYQQAGINYRYWQIGYEEWVEKKTATMHHDVVFLGNAYSDARKALGNVLLQLGSNGVKIGLYGFWPNSMAKGANLYDFAEGAALYRNSLMAVSDQQWPRASGYVSNRLFQAMAAGGCLVLQQRFDGMEELLGLRNGVHLRTWSTLDELRELVHYYKRADRERNAIAQTGHEFVKKHHSFKARVMELEGVFGSG